MTDIAELGFAVRTDGLKQGNQALDQTKVKAKELEDQAKKTGDAVSQVGDKAKASSAGVADLGKQYGLTEGQLRALQTRARESGTSFDEVAKKFVAARDGLRDVGPAAQAAATATQATATAARAAAPAMAQTATAARAAAVAKNEAAISAGALSAALNTARPAIIAAGGALGTLPAVAASARFGITGVATAITGGLAVALTNIVDKIDAAKARLGAVTGSFKTGSDAVDEFKRSAVDGGASVDGMQSAYQRLLGTLRTPPPERGVIRIGENVDAASRKISDIVTSASKALRDKFVEPAEIDRQLGVFADAFKAAGGKITGEVLRGVNEKAPELGRALALGLLGRGAGANENIIETAARQLDSIPAGIDRATDAAKRYQTVGDTAYDPNRVKPLSQALTELGRTANEIIERIGRVGGLSSIVDEANERLKRGADAALSPKDFGSDTSRTNASAMQPQETPSLWRRITDADRAMFGDDPTGVGRLVDRFNSWIADQFKGKEGEGGVKFSDLMGGGSGSLSRSEASDVLEGLNKSLAGFDDLATDLQKASDSAKDAEGTIDSVGDKLGEAGDASEQFSDSLADVPGAVTTVGEAITQAAAGSDALSTALPLAAEAATTFAGTTTEAMGGVSTAFGQTNEASAVFAQGFDGSMASAAASAEAGASRIVSSMQQIIDAANAAIAAQAAAASGAAQTGVGSVPYAMGGVFDGGYEITPFAKGGIIDRPTIFPLASGAALTGEAGPEAIMPLARGSDGKLGVTVTGGKSAGIPFDPIDAFERAIADQTTEFRDAIGAVGDKVTSGTAKIVAAIEAGNILLKDVAGKTGGSSSPVGTLSNAADTFDSAVQSFGESVQVASGGGQYTSRQSFGGGMTFGSNAGASGTTLGGPVFPRTTLINAGSGSSGRSISEALGFYDAMGGSGAVGAARGSAPNRPAPTMPSGSRSSGVQEANPGGYFGQYSDPQVVQPGSRDSWGATTSSGYLGGGASSVPNYDYGSDTSYTNSDYYYGGAYATGGSFTVPGAGGTDSVRVGIDATPGETVTVTPPGASGGGAGGGDIKINMTVNAADAESFIKNKHALIGAIARELKQYDARR